MERGDVVKFRNVVDPGDENLSFVVIESDDERPLVQALGTGLAIPPMNRYPIADLVVDVEATRAAKLARVQFRLAHWVTEWDRRQEKKAAYNRYALAIMLGSVQDNVSPALAAGKSLPDALKTGFNYPSTGLSFIAKGLEKDGLLSAEQKSELIPR